ncbi:hypothetical protein HPB47_006053 [Ixodes persulcatus]|uniref:Uncharacterized protein n=1 Tax=Ixodes persulcatus TaxID=34615 RepID=A0AC60PCL2_IXOPE|nr:hypothetical protein HPB47_006053 [Ixodes persulcatus]
MAESPRDAARALPPAGSCSVVGTSAPYPQRREPSAEARGEHQMRLPHAPPTTRHAAHDATRDVGAVRDGPTGDTLNAAFIRPDGAVVLPRQSVFVAPAVPLRCAFENDAVDEAAHGFAGKPDSPTPSSLPASTKEPGVRASSPRGQDSEWNDPPTQQRLLIPKKKAPVECHGSHARGKLRPQRRQRNKAATAKGGKERPGDGGECQGRDSAPSATKLCSRLDSKTLAKIQTPSWNKQSRTSRDTASRAPRIAHCQGVLHCPRPNRESSNAPHV